MSKRPNPVDLTKLARGMPCQIRIPHVCNGNPETTVACHVRMIGISGAGLKAPDLLVAFGCSDCHRVVDGQQACDIGPGERRLMLLEGMARTQAWFIEHGFVHW